MDAKYIAGARKFSWIKLKRSYRGELNDSVDVVIVGYYAGRGKRTEFGLGGLLTCVYDENSDEFRSIAKIGTGMTEEKIIELFTLRRSRKKCSAELFLLPQTRGMSSLIRFWEVARRLLLQKNLVEIG